MRTRVMLCLAGVLLAGCDGDGITVGREITRTADIQGVNGREHLSGEATVTWRAGSQQFNSSILFTGDTPGAIRPWHVHFNSCATGGGIVGGDGSYPRLNIGANGSGSVAVTVPAALDPNADYHINVHLSDAQMDVIIACGDLNGSATATGNPAGPGY